MLDDEYTRRSILHSMLTSTGIIYTALGDTPHLRRTGVVRNKAEEGIVMGLRILLHWVQARLYNLLEGKADG